MKSTLIIELKEAKEEIEGLISRLQRLDAFTNEFMEELKNMNLTDEQKTKREKMLLG